MDSILRYIENQCSLYEDVAAEEQTKSLIRLADKAKEFQKTFDSRRASVDTSFILEYMDDQRLTGILITDADMRTVASCVVEGMLSPDWGSVLSKTSSAMDAPNKCYAERIATQNGDYFDYAVMGRSDERGIILCYQQQEYEMMAGTQMSIKTLLTEYDFDVDGVIVVTDGVTVVGSNDESLNGKRADECEVIKDVRNVTDFGNLIPVTANGISYYAMRGKCKSNYAYVFYSEQRLFMQRSVLLAYTAAVYVLLMMIGIALHGRMDYVHRRERERSREKYRTEMDRLAKDAIRANEAKTDFLRRISHDIRTPVNGIRGMVDIVEDCDDDPARRKECYEKIRQASGYLLELVSGVLDMSKLESDEVVLEEIPFQLGSIFEEILVVIEQIAAKRNIRIVWEKKEITHRDFIGSPGYVKRVMMNILSNAVKYNRENGHIYISCMEIPSEQPEMTTMEFVCRDTGIGMTEEFQKYIFEPFAQEHTGSRTKFAGTGLGMAISRKLVEKMGGTITFESEKGVGTTFVIRVPFKIDLDADKREEQKDVSEKSIKGLHILLAEDNELNMEIAEFVLQNEGAVVTKAWNGQEAVELFKAHRPHIVLMDVNMPVMDGYEATTEIRKISADIPILAITAYAYASDEQRILSHGFDGYAAKPINPKILRSKIIDLLSARIILM